MDSLFSATGEACPGFADLEKWCIYDIQLVGACIKTVRFSASSSICNSLEIQVQY